MCSLEIRPDSQHSVPISVALQKTNIVPVAMVMTENTFTQMEWWPRGCTLTHLSLLSIHIQHVQIKMCDPGMCLACRTCSNCHVFCEIFAWWVSAEVCWFFFYYLKLSIDLPSQWGWRWRASRRGQVAPCCCPLVLGMAWSKLYQNRRSPGCAPGKCLCTQSSTPIERFLPWWQAENKTYWFQF